MCPSLIDVVDVDVFGLTCSTFVGVGVILLANRGGPLLPDTGFNQIWLGASPTISSFIRTSSESELLFDSTFVSFRFPSGVSWFKIYFTVRKND